MLKNKIKKKTIRKTNKYPILKNKIEKKSIEKTILRQLRKKEARRVGQR
jgi:hypothetical protein